MNKKIIALLLAGVLALGGVTAVVLYAKGADERAFGNAELVSVLVVTKQVPANSPANRLAGSVETTRLPKAAVAQGAVSDLASLGAKATNAVLVPGEQVLDSRFGTETKPVDETALPEGMQEIDVTLAVPRAPSGIKAGDRVGLIASFPKQNGDPGVSRMILTRLRVTDVKQGVAVEGGGAEGGDAVKVTFAVTTNQAEKVANVAEFGKIWLVAQNDKANVKGSKTVEANSKDVL